jgi:pyridoxal phosphate enzyme (YggS family)
MRVETTALAERIARVRETIAAAAERAGRRPDAVTIVAVSKTVEAERVAAAARCGLTHFGENRVQEAREKLAELGRQLSADENARLTWVLVGHLQTNKAALAVTLFSRIESVDSVHLARTLSRLGEKRATPVDVLLEVNVGGEASKSGFAPDELPGAYPELTHLPGLRIRGLMTVAPLVAVAEEARPYFRALRERRDSLVRAYPDVQLPELSMGMTGDYPVAIEEGATIVRIGRAIFGERPTPG